MISALPVTARRTVGGMACAVVLAGSTGCTGDSEPPSTDQSDGPAAGTAAIPLEARVTHVSGALAKSQRSNLERKVGVTISSYFDAAFLAGEYPRTDFSTAFANFTSGAARQAQRDRGLLTNAALGSATESVTTKQKSVSLSVLAPKRSAAGVTARIRLVYVADRANSAWTKVTISGRLLLTRIKAGRWQIFGYDVARSAVPEQRRATR